MTAAVQAGPLSSGSGPVPSSWAPGIGAALTAHQLNVLRLMAAGKSWRQIGNELGISIGGVGSVSKQILTKLGAASQSEAVRIGYELGLLETSPLVEMPKQFLEVLALVVEGRTNADIARCLGRSEHTVIDQVKEARRRLGARDRAHAAALSVALHLVHVDVRPFITPG
ncbi:response regulator transcription factor [Streptomyces caniscabiei]|uniref:response regulator transcription factor n=1 Tax=Streptomyces caniscabiei TaxID=2746961 RepID=UPI00187317DD|nr:helix-turn-helix transcriptional regulator [Streptomyces caniscabiei]MBE4761810.1 helix-turn-helix transcriptional regulator [Streptomyces caniscabiei]MDX2947929.1 helix-turn-helix transcriptional regulator [Streptomyces caniscabiei]